jgi:F0F1-type ATP synthase membrane subunit b/b'
MSDSHGNHSHHHHHHANPLFGVVVGLGLIGVVVWIALTKIPGIENTFDLQMIDVFMIFASAILFIGFWQLVSNRVFNPFLRLIAAREAATVGALLAADKIEHQALELHRSTEARILEARIAAMELKLAELNRAKQAAATIIEKAEHVAQESVRQVRWDLMTNLDANRKDVMREAEILAESLIAKIEHRQTN